MAKYEKKRSARRSTPRHPITMASTAEPPDPMPCALAAILLPASAAVCKEACFRGRAGCVPGHMCSGRSCVQSARVRRGCAAGAWAPAWVRGGGAWRCGRAACVSRVPRRSDTDACRHWPGDRVGNWATRCLPAVRGRACVGAWAGEAASGGPFGACMPCLWLVTCDLWGAVTLSSTGV